MTHVVGILEYIDTRDASNFDACVIDLVGPMAPNPIAAVRLASKVKGWVGVFAPAEIQGGTVGLHLGFVIPWRPGGPNKADKGQPFEVLSVLSHKRKLPHYLEQGPWVLEEPHGPSRALSQALQFVTSFTDPGDHVLCLGDFHGIFAFACRLLARECVVIEPLTKQWPIINARANGRAWEAFDWHSVTRWAPRRFGPGWAPTNGCDPALVARWEHWRVDLEILNAEMRQVYLDVAKVQRTRPLIHLTEERPLIHLT